MHNSIFIKEKIEKYKNNFFIIYQILHFFVYVFYINSNYKGSVFFYYELRIIV